MITALMNCTWLTCRCRLQPWIERTDTAISGPLEIAVCRIRVLLSQPLIVAAVGPLFVGVYSSLRLFTKSIGSQDRLRGSGKPQQSAFEKH